MIRDLIVSTLLPSTVSSSPMSAILESSASIHAEASPSEPDASLSLASPVSYSVRRTASSSAALDLASSSFSFLFLSLLIDSWSGTPSGTAAGDGWWTEPQTGHGSPSERPDARIPA